MFSEKFIAQIFSNSTPFYRECFALFVQGGEEGC